MTPCRRGRLAEDTEWPLRLRVRAYSRRFTLCLLGSLQHFEGAAFQVEPVDIVQDDFLNDPPIDELSLESDLEDIADLPLPLPITNQPISHSMCLSLGCAACRRHR
jgi:hypothetical protein